MSPETKIKHIAIIGLGLIGGSLAMALKVGGYHITGITKSTETIELAKQQRAIDQGFNEINHDVLKNIDLIFLSSPLSSIPGYIEEIAQIVKHEIILTDVGSTKLQICNFAKEVLPKNITFIGGHPMAGTEKSGLLAAQLSLFKNCAWMLTPLDESEKTKKTLALLQDIIRKIGARPILANPEKHDQAVALVSHLPLLASIGLCKTVLSLKDKELQNLASLIASSGFRDTTRIGGGNPRMNSDLITSNFLQVAALLPKYYEELEEIIKLAKESPDSLTALLSGINEWRSKLYNKEGKNTLLNKESDFLSLTQKG